MAIFHLIVIRSIDRSFSRLNLLAKYLTNEKKKKENVTPLYILSEIPLELLSNTF